MGWATATEQKQRRKVKQRIPLATVPFGEDGLVIIGPSFSHGKKYFRLFIDKVSGIGYSSASIQVSRMAKFVKLFCLPSSPIRPREAPPLKAG
jgi:hypothetical protein